MRRREFIGVLGAAATSWPTMTRAQTSNHLRRNIHVMHASTEREFDTVFTTLAQLQASALVIGTDAFFNTRSAQLAALSLRHGMPAISRRPCSPAPTM